MSEQEALEAELGMDFMDGSMEYTNYWETKKFFHSEELESWGRFSGWDDSSSPEGAESPAAASKNIDSERIRRKRLNERLFALRAVVPNITKMDKASIIKDAIEYIQNLQEQERVIKAELAQLESNTPCCPHDHNPWRRPCKSNPAQPSHCPAGSSPIHLHELTVSPAGERTVKVSISCSKRKGAMARLCEVFESLNLKVITASITACSGTVMKTAFVQGWGEEAEDELKMRIESAIAAINDPHSSLSC